MSKTKLSNLYKLEDCDQTIGIAFTTLFWSFLTWMAGTEEQKQKLATYIKDEHGAMCL
ncbi:MAG: hypothetical protein F6K39_37975, partial [Okeania sp. SIO3B3]|nr:hypothetical protein [Okeania sp. SIO3B3]